MKLEIESDGRNLPMRYKVSYRDQGEDGWLASVYTIPGCHTEGPTKEAARAELVASLGYYFDDVSDIELVDETEWENNPSRLQHSR